MVNKPILEKKMSIIYVCIYALLFFEENPHFRGKSLSKHPETKSVIFALLKHLYLNTLLYIKLYQLIKEKKSVILFLIL